MPLSVGVVRGAFEQSLRQVFGNIGGAIPFEVLEVKQATSQAFLKVDRRCAMLPLQFETGILEPIQCKHVILSLMPSRCASMLIRDLRKLWAAITLVTSHEGSNCHYQVRTTGLSQTSYHTKL